MPNPGQPITYVSSLLFHGSATQLVCYVNVFPRPTTYTPVPQLPQVELFDFSVFEENPNGAKPITEGIACSLKKPTGGQQWLAKPFAGISFVQDITDPRQPRFVMLRWRWDGIMDVQCRLELRSAGNPVVTDTFGARFP